MVWCLQEWIPKLSDGLIKQDSFWLVFKGAIHSCRWYLGQLSKVCLKKALLIHTMCSFIPPHLPRVFLCQVPDRITLLLHFLRVLRWVLEKSDCGDLEKQVKAGTEAWHEMWINLFQWDSENPPQSVLLSEFKPSVRGEYPPNNNNLLLRESHPRQILVKH